MFRIRLSAIQKDFSGAETEHASIHALQNSFVYIRAKLSARLKSRSLVALQN